MEESGLLTVQRGVLSGGMNVAPLPAARAADDRSASPRRMRRGCRPVIVSRAPPHACAQSPPPGSASQESGQAQGETPGATKSVSEGRGATPVMHPGARHSAQLATHGAPRERTARAAASRRVLADDIPDKLADMAANLPRRQAAVNNTRLPDRRRPAVKGTGLWQ